MFGISFVIIACIIGIGFRLFQMSNRLLFCDFDHITLNTPLLSHIRLKQNSICFKEFPRTVGTYTLVTPLEASSIPRVSESLGLPTQCFKAWSPRLSAPVLLRRVILPVGGADAGFDIFSNRLSSDSFALAQQVCGMNHPSFVRLRDVVPVDEFGDTCEYWFEFLYSLGNWIFYHVMEIIQKSSLDARALWYHSFYMTYSKKNTQ